ncbi:hypothetical protein V8F06_014568 [Rhypophila decipiens]
MTACSQQYHQCSNLEIYTDHVTTANNPRDVSAPAGAGSGLRCQLTAKLEELRLPASRGACLTLIFANADKVRECEICRRIFTEVLRIPQLWWTLWVRTSNGYFGCDETLNDNGVIDGYNTWFRYLIKQIRPGISENEVGYTWLKFNVFTRWEKATNHTFLVVFDPKPPVKEGILSCIDIPKRAPDQAGDLEDPYWIHVQILQHVTCLQDAAVWAIRKLVRAAETSRATVTASNGPDPDYGRYHDIARHAIHLSETTALSIKTTEHMLAMHRDFSDLLSSESVKYRRQHAHSRIQKRLYFFEHMMHSLNVRSAATRDRLLNEIQLAFNVASQCDSHVSVAISRAVQCDSYSMRSIAFLTLTFLPATFVSALFSMSFFNYDPDLGWTVSGEIWLYFAIAGPVTVIAITLWLAWQKLFPPNSLIHNQGSEAPSRVENMAPSFRTATWGNVKNWINRGAYELEAV